MLWIRSRTCGVNPACQCKTSTTTASTNYAVSSYVSTSEDTQALAAVLRAVIHPRPRRRQDARRGGDAFGLLE